MKISVFGLGYVGCVTAACFAELGHEVIGVDVVDYKVEAINNGTSPIEEKGLKELLKKHHNSGKLRATKSTEKAILNSDISFVCVGTPSKRNGDLDLSYLKKACQEIAQILKDKPSRHIIVIRSTMFPGSLNVIRALIEGNSEKKEGKDFGLAVNPEFLREGSAIKDFFNPPYIVVGSSDKEVCKKVLSCYSGIKAKKLLVKEDVAQMIKYVSNSWHALKVSYANEIGEVCRKLGIDGKKLMSLFCEDTQLNISSYYLKPGFAYGGSCLPKDLSALKKKASQLKLSTPLIDSISLSNLEHMKRAIKLIESKKKRNIGILGITFKPDTDDIRGNPILYVINNLVSKGFNVKIYDPLIKRDNLKGIVKSYRKEVYDLINKENLKDKVKDIKSSFAELREVLSQDIIILSNGDKSLKEYVNKLKDKKMIIDLQNILD